MKRRYQAPATLASLGHPGNAVRSPELRLGQRILMFLNITVKLVYLLLSCLIYFNDYFHK